MAPPRRLIFLATLLALIPIIFIISLFRSAPDPSSYDDSLTSVTFAKIKDPITHLEQALRKESLDVSIDGEVIMPHLGNETAKAELGRATWKLLHLMTLRFPESPTPDERQALRQYFYLFSRLYPCGECAKHFQAMLKEYPPQTSSRKSASLWLCHLHNLVNERLLKPQFDCLTLDDVYDCGCGEDPGETSSGSSPADKKDEVTGVGLIKGGR